MKLLVAGGGSTNPVPILMYHSVSANPPNSTRALSVHPAEFALQLEHLRREGFEGLSFGELCERRRVGRAVPARSVVLTFDDGYADFLEQAMPAMIEYGFPATVFITTGWLRDAGRWAAGIPPDRMLSWRELSEVSELGAEVGAHSHSHPQLDQISEANLLAELADSRQLLEDHLTLPITSLAYPYGYSSNRVREVSRHAGYTQAASVRNAAASSACDPFRVPRLTVRRSTTLSDFSRIVRLEWLQVHYARARLLTVGWAGVRRMRSAAGTLLGQLPGDKVD